MAVAHGVTCQLLPFDSCLLATLTLRCLRRDRLYGRPGAQRVQGTCTATATQDPRVRGRKTSGRRGGRGSRTALGEAQRRRLRDSLSALSARHLLAETASEEQ